MALLVQKYGGTSVGNPERISAVAERVAASVGKGNRVALVVSAMAGETDRMLALARALSLHPAPRELDALLATGEQASAALLCIALEQRGLAARSYNGLQLPIRTDGIHTRARIRRVETAAIAADLEAGRIPVIAGFQGVAEDGSITTLARGGSDTTAVALAAALGAAECQIYTDVKGVYTADPRIVEAAQRLESITFEEMLELAGQGSKVLHVQAVEQANRCKIPLRVLSSWSTEDDEGTLIDGIKDGDAMTGGDMLPVSGIAHNRDEAQLTVRDVPNVPGAAARILGAVAKRSIDVDLIVQNAAANGGTDLSFTVHRRDLAQAEIETNKSAKALGAKDVITDDKIAKVSLVGIGMRSHAGVAHRMFTALAEAGINIRIISTSEIKIAVLIEEKFLEQAVCALHAAFHLEEAADIVEAAANS